MKNLRFLIYSAIVALLLFAPLIQTEKSVKITQKPQEASLSVVLTKEPTPPKVVTKVAPKKVVKKRKVKKIVKKPKAKKVIKKVVPKKVIKPKPIKKALPPKPKVDEKLLLAKKLEQERAEAEKKRKLEEAKKLEEERKQKEREAKALEMQRYQEHLASLKESYYSQIYNTIASKKRYPKKALRFKKEGSVKVSFTILADGSFKDFKIVTPSDEKIFNKAVKKLFKKLHSFDAPPSEIELPLSVSITINYNIKRK